jgi:hypothetical protein
VVPTHILECSYIQVDHPKTHVNIIFTRLDNLNLKIEDDFPGERFRKIDNLKDYPNLKVLSHRIN